MTTKLSAVTTALSLVLSLGSSPTVLMAQELEPGVQTSTAAAPPPTTTTTTTTTKPTPPPTPMKPKPVAPTLPPAATPNAAAAPAAAKSKSSDRIELDTTQISGNRELPKVMYVVPWRRADPGDFAGRPPNSLLDEALTPVDRDVFRRQNQYYGAVQDQAQSAKSQAGAASAGSDGSTHKDEK